MSKWLRKEKARACPIHQIIMDEAAKRLAHEGVFSKEEILEATNLEAMTDAVRWDYVREFLQEEQGCELVPLAAAYFKRHKRQHEVLAPEKYLASGYGKKTAGFCAVTPENDHLVVHKVKQKVAMANGVGAALRQYLKEIEAKRGQPVLETVIRPLKSISNKGAE